MRHAILIGALFLLLPSLTLAAAPRTFGELATQLVIIMDSAAAVLIVVGLASYLYTLAMGISKGGDKMTEMRTYIVWGILALFLMVSIWGVLQLLQNTLFGGDVSVSSPTGSYGGQGFSPFGP